MTTIATEDDTTGAVALYSQLIGAWNARNARAFAECFEATGTAVGFDGTQMDGAPAIDRALSAVFEEHRTATYVTIVRDVRVLTSGVVVLRAVAGMVTPGSSQIKADVNAIQTLIACLRGDEWKLALFQNTPAAFHGRPDEAKALTKELQEVLDARATRTSIAHGIH